MCSSIENLPLGRRRSRTACKYAVKVDVDVATLRAFGQILYHPVHWPSKTGLLVGAGAELRVNLRLKWMSTSPLCGRLAKFYTIPYTGRQKLASWYRTYMFFRKVGWSTNGIDSVIKKMIAAKTRDTFPGQDKFLSIKVVLKRFSMKSCLCSCRLYTWVPVLGLTI